MSRVWALIYFCKLLIMCFLASLKSLADFILPCFLLTTVTLLMKDEGYSKKFSLI